MCFLFSLVAVLTLNKQKTKCGSLTLESNNTYYILTSNEISMFSLLSIVSTFCAVLCFLLYINTLKVINIILALILLVINCIVLSDLANLSNSATKELNDLYSVSSGISIPILYSCLSLILFATIGTVFIYGRHFIKNIKRII